MPTGDAQDWVYCASLKSDNQGAYLGSYSGKVFDIDSNGSANCVYDLGICPDKIFDMKNVLYLQTATRLYIIKKPNSLIAMVDIYDQGEVFITDSKIFLIDKKRFQLYDHFGSKLGEVISSNPIREIKQHIDGLELLTKQHSTIILGLEL